MKAKAARKPRAQKPLPEGAAGAFAGVLRTVMEESGKSTHEALADSLDVSGTHVTLMLSGKREPGPEVVDALWSAHRAILRKDEWTLERLHFLRLRIKHPELDNYIQIASEVASGDQVTPAEFRIVTAYRTNPRIRDAINLLMEKS